MKLQIDFMYGSPIDCEENESSPPDYVNDLEERLMKTKPMKGWKLYGCFNLKGKRRQNYRHQKI